MHHEWKERRNFLLLESFKRWIIYPKYYLTDPNFQTRAQSKMRFSRHFIRYRAKSVVDIYASLNESWQTLPLNVVTFLPLCQNMLPQPFIIQTRWGLHIFTTFFNENLVWYCVRKWYKSHWRKIKNRKIHSKYQMQN